MTEADTSKGLATEPSIRFSCTCGTRYTIKASFAGKTTACKHCGASIVIPSCTLQSADTPTNVEKETRRILVSGIAIVALTLLGGGYYTYYSLRQDAHRSCLAQYNCFLQIARDAIAERDIQGAIDKLQAAIALPDDVTKNDAVALLKEAHSALASPQQVLQSMSDVDFQSLCKTRTLPASSAFSYAPLNTFFVERLLTATGAEIARRERIRTKKAEAQALYEQGIQAAKSRLEAALKSASEENAPHAPGTGPVEVRKDSDGGTTTAYRSPRGTVVAKRDRNGKILTLGQSETIAVQDFEQFAATFQQPNGPEALTAPIIEYAEREKEKEDAEYRKTIIASAQNVYEKETQALAAWLAQRLKSIDDGAE